VMVSCEKRRNKRPGRCARRIGVDWDLKGATRSPFDIEIGDERAAGVQSPASDWGGWAASPVWKLSATYLNGPADGRPPWAMACLGSRHEGVREHIYLQSGYIDTWLGTERKGGFGRGSAGRW
jgi:hypothetical protein